MAAAENERPLPRFGDWDVNDPATSEGFTVIFSKASNDKKSGKSTGNAAGKRRFIDDGKQNEKRKWCCCVFG
ncbi:hypothetical protein SLA2020_135240 [Shorea laevis]